MSEFKVTTAQHGQLHDLESSYRFIHAGATPSSDGTVGITCEIVCKVTKQVWATGTGGNKSEALSAALDAASNARRPMTPAQVATTLTATEQKLGATERENQELRRRVEELENEKGGEEASDLSELRTRYLELTGQEADKRWGAKRLSEAIDEALAAGPA